MILITNNNKDLLQQSINDNKPLDDFDTSNVTNMSCMFELAKSFNQQLDHFDTSHATTMWRMFSYAESFNQPLDNFDTRNVTNMGSMFCKATSFNQPLDNFDTKNVTNMYFMFNGATSFNQPLDNFDLSNINTMDSMFDGATSMFIGYIMRFAARSIFVYNKYDAMNITNYQFSNSEELDYYIIYLQSINSKCTNQSKIDSALDGFIID